MVRTSSSHSFTPTTCMHVWQFPSRLSGRSIMQRSTIKGGMHAACNIMRSCLLAGIMVVETWRCECSSLQCAWVCAIGHASMTRLSQVPEAQLTGTASLPLEMSSLNTNLTCEQHLKSAKHAKLPQPSHA